MRFYCDICLVSLSSMETMRSHCQEVKHQKKKLALKSENIQMDEKNEKLDLESIKSSLEWILKTNGFPSKLIEI